MKKITLSFIVLLFSFQAQAGFLCDMLMMDVMQTYEYEQALDGLSQVRTTLDEVSAIRQNLANGGTIDESHPGLDQLHAMVKEALVEEEKAQGRSATITIALDAGALTFAYFLWKSYASNPQSLMTVGRNAFEKKFNAKTWLIPGLIASVVGAGYMRYLMAQRKEQITTLREHLQILATAQVKQEYLSYLEDIIDDNRSTLSVERSRLLANGCLRGFEFEDGQSYCEENPGVEDSGDYDKCF